MPATQSPTATTDASHKASFFRQSGWLMIANIAGGVMMWGVHFLSKAIPKPEYAVFGVFLAMAILIPTMPLQIVLAQQTADALATGRERQLASKIRLAFFGTLLLWAISAVVVFFLHRQIIEKWQIVNPAGLWVTMVVLLFGMWLPIFVGVLQGQQNFLWLGWSLMLNGLVRILVAFLAVRFLLWQAAGMMTAVLMGLLIAVLIGAWQTRRLWSLPAESFDWRGLLKQIIPLVLGVTAFQFLFTADTMFTKAYFDGDTVAAYVGAGTLSRALMWLVGPLATVMFPRIVHSSAKSEKTDIMGLVLVGTAVLAIAGALGLWVLGPWVIKLVYKTSYVQEAAAVLPWYAFAMVPLSVGNVLLSNLLARSAFRVVPVICLLAVTYGIALTQFHSSLVAVLQTLGFFNLLMLAACAWFTWFEKPGKKSGSPAPAVVSALLLVAVLGYGVVRGQSQGQGQGRTDLFSDDFKGKLGEGWSWVRENPATWRISERGLQIRIEPGNMWGGQNNARNLLVRALPATVQEHIEVSVALENRPTNQYEQVDLVWYYDDSNMVKLGQELVDGKLCIVMGREEGDKTRTIAIVPLDPSSAQVEVRFLARTNQLRGDFRLAGAAEWRLAGNCDLPAPANTKPRISLQCYPGSTRPGALGRHQQLPYQ
jgi:O-antigen/teichoic acid export membrane protein/regulation of enolase protein 1 (concanavalin A-like superfamily)